jgi:hypothetical protein
MNDLDERIAQTLHRQAPVFERPMPKGTTIRVRLREASTALVGVVVIAGLALGVSVLVRMPERVQPASEQTVPAPIGSLTDPQGVSGGADDATAVAGRTGATGATEDTTAHGTNSTEPYTEQVIGQEAYLLTQKHVVATGHVGGIEWSLAGYDTRPYDGKAFAAFLGGTCGDLLFGDQGEYGGITFCLHTPETAPDAAFAMAGFANDSDPIVGPITAYAGLISSDVASVELRLADGTTTALPLSAAPSNVDARYFEVVLDPGTAGRVVALGADGSQLDSAGLCVDEPAQGPSNFGCGHGLMDVSSVVTTP